MESIPKSSGEHPGGETPHRDVAAPSGDVLEDVLSRLAAVEASTTARAVLAQVLTATLLAFTRTSSVRDPLPDTAPGSAEEALAAMAGVDHLRASLAAVDATWQVAAEQRIRRDDAAQGMSAEEQGRGAGQEIALARRISPAASSFSQAKARRLVQHMPGTVDRLWSGAVTDQQASAVAGALDGAGDETCRRIDDEIREHPEMLHGKGHRRLQAEIRAMVQRLEPETSRERAERAARSRHIRMTPLGDGMARVTATLRALDAVAMMNSLHSRAESQRAAGAKTSLSALEADLLVEDVQHGAQGGENADLSPRPRLRPGLDIGIIITDTALLGRDDEAETAQLEGYGTIPAHIVRDTVGGRPPGHLRHDEGEHPDEEVAAFYRRLFTAPRTGDLIAMESRARAFPAGLARMLRWRDSTCRTPWCNAQIRHSDHALPYHRGGPTSFANGQGLCARCNLLKEHGLWVLTPVSRTGSGDDSGPGDDPPAGAAPPAAWIWNSPHGAMGISPTPPLITPWPTPPVAVEEEPRDEEPQDSAGPASSPPP
ncbi:HNH endonuclease [Brachybacterium avium]|uniref:HNH endonuclease n=1 Tax=Brachybacterium avium TaxID=2017485 RepID=A0A220UDX7_9MICO|nr:HNH endonuclease signature motif containing protein [Brachybacterium avium]ASK66408.1 HNH endonuclease [Brachybacterium avium]